MPGDLIDGAGSGAGVDAIGDSLTLYIGNRTYSSWSLRGWLAVRLSGLPCRVRVIPLHQPSTIEAIRLVSPSARVPVLYWHHGGDEEQVEAIWDSCAIFETLAERVKDVDLWPSDSRDRAFARAICAEIHGGFTALRVALPMNVRRRPLEIQLNAKVGADIARIIEIWRECRQRAGSSAYGDEGGCFLFGRPGLVDAAFAPVASRFHTYDIGLSEDARAYVDMIHDWLPMRQWINDAVGEAWRISHIDSIGTELSGG